MALIERTCSKCSTPIHARGKSGLCRSCLNTNEVLQSRWKQARAIHVAIYSHGTLTHELTDNGEDGPLVINLGAARKMVITRGKKGTP